MYLLTMHGLLSKLAGVDSSAERGLRVIDFYDQLVIHNADLEAVTRATAVLVETVAGAVLDRSGDAAVIGPDGELQAPAGPTSHALVQEIVVDGDVVGRVWIERPVPEDEREWDRLIIERMAQCLATISARSARRPTQLGFSDPAIVHVLLQGDTAESERARAARLLGFRVGEQVRAVAVAADSGLVGHLATVRRHVAGDAGVRTVATALTGNLGVVIAAVDEIVAVPLREAAAGVGPSVMVEDCHVSWTAARNGVRFAALGGRWPSFVSSADLGCVAVLADLSAASVRELPDVLAVAALARAKHGASDIALLDGLTSFNSLREIAEALHLHHSSVGYRLGQLCDQLGYDVRSQTGRYRAKTALTLWRLHGERPTPG